MQLAAIMLGVCFGLSVFNWRIEMKKLRDFECANCGHCFEEFTLDDVTSIQCKSCGSRASRLVSAARYFDNTTGGSPSTNYKKV